MEKIFFDLTTDGSLKLAIQALRLRRSAHIPTWREVNQLELAVTTDICCNVKRTHDYTFVTHGYAEIHN